MWARLEWWAGRESNPHSRRRLVYSQRSSPPAQPTHDDDCVSNGAGCPHGDEAHAVLFSCHSWWSRRRDSNPEPAVYKTAALPIELRRHGSIEDTRAPANGAINGRAISAYSASPGSRSCSTAGRVSGSAGGASGCAGGASGSAGGASG